MAGSPHLGLSLGGTDHLRATEESLGDVISDLPVCIRLGSLFSTIAEDRPC